MNEAPTDRSRERKELAAGPRRGRPEAAAAIWNWSAPVDDRAQRASRARRAAAIRFLVAAVAAGAFFAFDRLVMAAVVASIGLLTLSLGVLSPLGGYAALERAVTKAGELVGAALTWLLLTPVYFLFFAPFGLLFKRGRRDPMERRIEKAAKSYWKKRGDDRPLDRPY